MARMTRPEWPLPPRETLAARALRASSAEKRAAELESQLDSAREELLRRENEIVSLRKSLELSTGENARLSGGLEERFAAADTAKSQIDCLTRALATAERERDEADRRRHADTSGLSTLLEAALARARAAEKLLAQAQQDLCARNMKNADMERKVADAESEIEENEREIRKLTHSRSVLTDELARLLTIGKSRDADLARAKESYGRLAELVVQLEGKLRNSKSDKKIEEIAPRLENTRERPGAKKSGNNGPSGCAVLRRDLDKDAWLLGPLRSAMQLGS